MMEGDVSQNDVFRIFFTDMMTSKDHESVLSILSIMETSMNADGIGTLLSVLNMESIGKAPAQKDRSAVAAIFSRRHLPVFPMI